MNKFKLNQTGVSPLYLLLALFIAGVQPANSADQPTLLADDFNDGNFDGWVIVDEGVKSSPSSWSVAGGVLVQNSNIYSPFSGAADISMLGTYLEYAGGAGWTDYRVRMTLRSEDDDSLGVMFRVQDSNNYYRFSWDQSRSFRRLVKRENGVFTLLAEDNVPYVQGQTYQVEIVALDMSLEVWIDDVQVFSVTDTGPAYGGIALYSWGNQGSYFDDVVVEEFLPLSASLGDNFDDGSFDGWTIVDEGNRSSPSAWSVAGGVLVQNSNIYSPFSGAADISMLGTYLEYAGGAGWTDYRVRMTLRSEDDDSLGVMFRVQDSNNYYRFSWDQSRSFRRLVKRENGVFTLLAEDNVPYVQGQTYQVEIVALDMSLEVWIDDVQVFSVTDTGPAYGGIALYSWGNQGSYFDDVVVEEFLPLSASLGDNFDDGSFDGWTIVDEGNRSSPSAWSVAGGVLVQNSNIYSPFSGAADISMLGTYLEYAGGAGWTDYRVRMTLRSEDDDSLGVMFRVQDSNNYYRFSWDQSRSFRRLVKRENGVFTLLAEDNVPYVQGQTYQVEIVALDMSLEVWIDDVQVFSMTDTGPAYGGIALYSWGNQGSYFDDVVVEELILPVEVDPYQVVITEVTPGTYEISADAGAVGQDTSITIDNISLGAQTIVFPNLDGSFITQIAGSPGDRLELTVANNTGASPPIVQYAGQLTIKNPYTASGNWYLGQGHMHTNRSGDAVTPPVEMEAAYYDAGYDFVVSTDHRARLSTESDPIAGLTQNPDNSASGKDLLWIRGSEITLENSHMGAWGYSTNSEPFPAVDSTQDQIDEVRARGGITAINHPRNDEGATDWRYLDIVPVNNISMVEAFNGNQLVYSGQSTHILEAIDLADEFRQVWWTGVDDSHDRGAPNFDVYGIVVQTDSNAPVMEDILAAADSGNMYIRETSTGPEILSVNVVGNTVSVTLVDEPSNYTITWKKRGNEIVQQDTNINTISSYSVVGDEGYVRAEIERTSDGKHTYTQPIYIGNNHDLITGIQQITGSNSEHLIDNDGSTYWDAGSPTGSFILDVGEIRQINAIKIDWYAPDGATFNYFIEASDTGAFGGEQEQIVRETYSNRSILTLDFFDTASRYLLITITGQSNGTGATPRIREVEVFDSSPASTQLYIDNINGDDANSGFTGSPWRTFTHARLETRPRDILNFINTGVPYTGGLHLGGTGSGKHQFATVRYTGDPDTLTEIDASGLSRGVFIEGASNVEWMHFNIHSATDQNILTSTVVDNITLKYNVLHNSRNGIYGAGDLTATHNIVFDNSISGFAITGNGTSARLFNNVIYGNGIGVSLSGLFDTNAVVRNNVIAGNTNYALLRKLKGSVIDSHNCVEGTYSGIWQQTGSISADPLLMNPDNRDFSLQAGSPCIDAGIDMNLGADFAGEPPYDVPQVLNTGSIGDFSLDYTDMGAYEFSP